MINIVIADDHTLVREGFKKILQLEPDLKLTGEAASACGAFEKLAAVQCDILVLDISLPDKSGLEILKEIKNCYPKIRVLVLSMYSEDRYSVRAFQAGADGYLTKNSAAEDLITALRTIQSGKKYISPTVAEELIRNLKGNRNKPDYSNLSDREFQIMLLIGSGKTVTHISKELFLSVSTVNTHRTHILEKLHVQNSAALIRYVIENNLLE